MIIDIIHYTLLRKSDQKVQTMRWIFANRFSDLTTKQLYDLLKLRQDVFIIEQNCIYEDIDGIDLLSYHLLLYSQDDVLLASCRIVPERVKLKSRSIGRVVSNPAFRRKGYGKMVMEKALEELKREGAVHIEIEAQTYLIRFYRSFGFREKGDAYPVDDIPHILMELQPDING